MAFKIDSEGATAQNTFTEGNPSQGIPATVVSDDWLNMVQGELVDVVENLAGITLDKQDNTQLGQAILQLIGEGGTQKTASIANNQGSNLGLGADFTFDKSTVKGVQIQYDLERVTDTQNVQESGVVYLTHDISDDTWRISQQSFVDISGVDFFINASTGELEYQSDDLTGANYSGSLRAVVTEIKQ